MSLPPFFLFSFVEKKIPYPDHSNLLFLLIVDTLLEAGEFSIDLYTMPDVLTKMLWEHLVSSPAVPWYGASC